MSTDDLYRTLGLLLSNQSERVDLNTIDGATWGCLVSLAEVEGVAPLLYWIFKDHPAASRPSIPDGAYSRLQAAYYQTLSRNLLLYQELVLILQALGEVGIPVIVLKGAALAATVYDDIGLRPMGDIDLLVHKKDLNRIFQIMEKMSYKLDLSRLRLFLMSGVLYEANFDGGGLGNSHVEFHWSLIGGEYSRYRPKMDWFWEHSKLISTKLINARFLEPEAHLLYLAAHLILKHGMAEAILLWMNDLYLLMYKQNLNIDWDEIMHQARSFHWESCTLVAIQEVCRLFDVNLSQEVFGLLTHNQRSKDFPLVLSKMKPRSHLQSALDELRMVNWLGKCGWLVDFIFPRYSYLKQIYPSKRWNHQFIYTVFYWARMTKDVFNTLKNAQIKPGKH
jgi:hypothetical protein